MTDAVALAEGAADPELRGRVDYIEKWLIFNINRGPAITAIWNGRVVASWGIRQVRPGVGSAWAVFCSNIRFVQGFPSAEAMEYLEESLWTMRQSIRLIAAEFGFKRIRAHSRKGFRASQRLMRHLGFEKMHREAKTHYFYKMTFD